MDTPNKEHLSVLINHDVIIVLLIKVTFVVPVSVLYLEFPFDDYLVVVCHVMKLKLVERV